MKPSTNFVTATIPTFAKEIADIGLSKAREYIREGKIKTITVGARRLVVVSSYYELIEKELEGPPKDARRNDGVPAFGSKFPPQDGRRPRGRPRKYPIASAAE
jgi:hypothetical protein